VSITAPSTVGDERTAPATANALAAAIMLALFVLVCLAGSARKDVTSGFDEPAHAAYVAHIQHTGNPWPALEDMRLIDPHTFRFTDEPNYLNHPPIFYDLLAAIGPTLEGHPDALRADRLFDVGLVALGLAALLALGLKANFSWAEFYAYAMPLLWIPFLVQLAATVNNDDLAFLGGALATVGLWQTVATGGRVWLGLALVGVLIAGWAKLTGLLLTATMVSAAFAYLAWRGRLRRGWAIAAGLAFALAAAPYLIEVWQYGSPTPQTPAQVALIADGARAAGWADLPRKSFPAYLALFVVAFIADWMPTLGARSTFNYAMLAIPVAAFACAVAGVACALERLRRRRETTRDVIAVAGMGAIAVTFAIHVGYSYGRHLATGWLLDAYPRYYLPLAAIVPLAALTFAAGITASRWRGAVLAFLALGPILVRIFGAPL
jgi:hypothetical protein